MPVDHAAAMAVRQSGLRVRYDSADSVFYALSIGIGADPLEEAALDFVLETRGPRIVPTMAAVLAPSLSHAIGLDMARVLHGEQRLTVHRPLPPAADLIIDSFVTSVIDKGPDKGALVAFDSVARVEGEDAPVFTLGRTLFARGDGGCGGPPTPVPPRHAIPERAPDLTHRLATRPDQALLYRLNGDLNPLHADPAAARRSGFDRPILHGLCSYALACRALIESGSAMPDAIGTFDVRFTAPVYPGETILSDIWIDDDLVSFRCRVEERGVVSIDNGRCQLR